MCRTEQCAQRYFRRELLLFLFYVSFFVVDSVYEGGQFDGAAAAVFLGWLLLEIERKRLACVPFLSGRRKTRSQLFFNNDMYVVFVHVFLVYRYHYDDCVAVALFVRLR